MSPSNMAQETSSRFLTVESGGVFHFAGRRSIKGDTSMGDYTYLRLEASNQLSANSFPLARDTRHHFLSPEKRAYGHCL